MNGPLAYLPIRRPLTHELVNEDLITVCLTSPHGWDPYGGDSLSLYNADNLSDNSCSISKFLSQSFNRSITNISSNQRQVISIEDVMKRWGVENEMARQTLMATWQEYTRSTDNLNLRFKTARVHSRYRQLLDPYSGFDTDTLFSIVLSLRGNTCGQVYYKKAKFYKV